jgi:hypothetical protein
MEFGPRHLSLDEENLGRSQASCLQPLPSPELSWPLHDSQLLRPLECQAGVERGFWDHQSEDLGILQKNKVLNIKVSCRQIVK